VGKLEIYIHVASHDDDTALHHMSRLISSAGRQ